MLKCFKNEKLWCVVGGAVAMVIGKKIVTAKKTRQLAVSGLAGCLPEYEGRSTGYLLRCQGTGRYQRHRRMRRS